MINEQELMLTNGIAFLLFLNERNFFDKNKDRRDFV